LTTLAIVKTAGAAGAAKASMAAGSAVNNSNPPRNYNRA
jgi:type IV secretion system protein VirB6